MNLINFANKTDLGAVNSLSNKNGQKDWAIWVFDKKSKHWLWAHFCNWNWLNAVDDEGPGEGDKDNDGDVDSNSVGVM